MECAPNRSSTDCVGWDDCLTTSETWAPILDPPLGAVESSGVVTSPTCVPTVSIALLSLSSDLGSSPFFSFLPPFYSCVDSLGSCWDIVLTYISSLLWLWVNKLIFFLWIYKAKVLLGVIVLRVHWEKHCLTKGTTLLFPYNLVCNRHRTIGSPTNAGLLALSNFIHMCLRELLVRFRYSLTFESRFSK